MEKVETHYTVQLKASEYDFLVVVEDAEGRIKITFLDSRWRTNEETVSLLKEIISHLDFFKKKKDEKVN